jgi:hypothetical protein
VCSGNSLTLLAGDDDMLAALRAMRDRARAPGGLVVIGVHNYRKPQALGQNLIVRHAQLGGERAEVALDVRLYGERVDVTYMFVRLIAGRWRLKTYTKSYANLAPTDLKRMMLDAGLRSVRLLDVTGRRDWSEEDEWVLAVGER